MTLVALTCPRGSSPALLQISRCPRACDGAWPPSIVDADHLAGDDAGFVAQEVGDDVSDSLRCARFVDLKRYDVDRDIALP